MKRGWTIEQFVASDGELYPNPKAGDELDALMLDLAGVLRTIGGTVAAIAERVRIGDGPDDYVPLRYRVRWESQMPTQDARKPPADEPEDDPFDPELEEEEEPPEYLGDDFPDAVDPEPAPRPLVPVEQESDPVPT